MCIEHPIFNNERHAFESDGTEWYLAFDGTLNYRKPNEKYFNFVVRLTPERCRLLAKLLRDPK